MGKIWIKSSDPQGQCCGCDGKTSPCDSCCSLIIPNLVVDGVDTPFSNLSAAQTALAKQSHSCLVETIDNSIAGSNNGRTSIKVTQSTNGLSIIDNGVDPNFSGPFCTTSPSSVSYSASSMFGDAGHGNRIITLNFVEQAVSMNSDGTWNCVFSTLNAVGNAAVGTIKETYIVNVSDSTHTRIHQGEPFKVPGCSTSRLDTNFLAFVVAQDGTTYDMNNPNNPYVAPPTLQIPYAGGASSYNDYYAFKATVSANSTITLNYNATATFGNGNNYTPTIIMFVQDDFGSSVYNQTTTTPNGTLNIPISKAGNYYFVIMFFLFAPWALSALNGSLTTNFTSNSNFKPCSIQIKYLDSSGATKYLPCSSLP